MSASEYWWVPLGAWGKWLNILYCCGGKKQIFAPGPPPRWTCDTLQSKGWQATINRDKKLQYYETIKKLIQNIHKSVSKMHQNWPFPSFKIIKPEQQAAQQWTDKGFSREPYSCRAQLQRDAQGHGLNVACWHVQSACGDVGPNR